jgi:hypothetical protein
LFRALTDIFLYGIFKSQPPKQGRRLDDHKVH